MSLGRHFLIALTFVFYKQFENVGSKRHLDVTSHFYRCHCRKHGLKYNVITCTSTNVRINAITLAVVSNSILNNPLRHFDFGRFSVNINNLNQAVMAKSRFEYVKEYETNCTIMANCYIVIRISKTSCLSDGRAAHQTNGNSNTVSVCVISIV